MFMYPGHLMAKEWYTSGHLKYYLSHTVYDDDNTTPILNKELKDKDVNNITDLAAGTLAAEMANTV